MPDFTVHWHQAEPENVNSWEFQFQRVGSDDWEWVQRVEPVDDCADCFSAIVELPRTALFVRSRGVGDAGTSDWSPELHVLPEPGLATAVMIGVLWIALVVWMTKRLH